MLGRLWRPRPELGAGHPSWLRSLVPALSSASHHDISMSRAKVCSQPPPHVSVFVTSSVLAALEGGVGGGGGGVLFISAQEKLCLVAAHGVDSQGPDSGSSAS